MQGARDSTNQRRVSVDQSEPSSQNATRGAERTSICERTRCGAQRKHVNIIRSHGHECHFAEVQSGDIRRWRHLSLGQSEPSSRHATTTRSTRTSTRPRTVEMGHRVQGAPDSTNQCERARDSTKQSRPPGMHR